MDAHKERSGPDAEVVRGEAEERVTGVQVQQAPRAKQQPPIGRVCNSRFSFSARRLPQEKGEHRRPKRLPEQSCHGKQRATDQSDHTRDLQTAVRSERKPEKSSQNLSAVERKDRQYVEDKQTKIHVA